MEFNYNKCPECGYVNKNQPDVCPSCGCDLREYRNDLYSKEQAYEAAEQARKKVEKARKTELAEKSYSFICDTMDGMTKTEDVNKDCLFAFIAAFLDGSGIAQYESVTERHTNLLMALYRYYNENKDEPNDRRSDIYECYTNAVNLMGRYISSSRNNRLKSSISGYTPSYGIKCFFDLIITALEVAKSGISPFNDEFCNEFRMADVEVYDFIDRFINDDEMSANDELNGMVEQYYTYLRNTYEQFSDWEGFEDFEKDDGFWGWYDEEDPCVCCPNCDTAIKLIGVAGREARYHDRIKCAACKKTYFGTPYYLCDCPECGYSNSYEHLFGINSIVCERCGLNYEIDLGDPDDDEGAIDSVLDDSSET